ncbi:MAG: hypothetical protein NTV34_18610 [Proteobacteria bacterium]|nr:hypothetical protein [Pseudomonadota bacterium]
MDLVRLYLNGKGDELMHGDELRCFNIFWSCVIAVVMTLASSGNLQAQQPTPSQSDTPISTPINSVRNLDGFPATRAEVLSLIGGATQTIRIVTDFLSDGEIASALYIAKYRKVNVQVLLGAPRATSVLSRLNFLKEQSISVWLRPRTLAPSYPTVIVVDQAIYTLNADLDYQARHRKFTLTRLPDNLVKNFEDDFQKAANTGISPTPKPLPLVGRPGGSGRQRVHNAPYNQPNNPSQSSALRPNSDQGPSQNTGGEWQDGTPAYRYGRTKDKPANGIPTKLPRNTILQDRSQHH